MSNQLQIERLALALERAHNDAVNAKDPEKREAAKEHAKKLSKAFRQLGDAGLLSNQRRVPAVITDPAPKPSLVQDISNFAEGVGINLRGRALGAEQLYDEIAGLTGSFFKPAEAGRFRREIDKTTQEIERFRKEAKPITDTGAGFAGAMVPDIAASLLARKPIGMAALGGAEGATQPLTEEERGQRVARTIGGAAIAPTIQGAGSLASSLLRPRTSQPLKGLVRGGVKPTAGNLLDSSWLRFGENTLRQFPPFNTVMMRADKEALESFNRFAIREAAKAGGIRMPVISPGNKGVGDLESKLKDAFQDTLKDVNISKVPASIKRRVKSATGNLLGSAKKEARDEIKTLQKEYLKNGPIDGFRYQELDQALGDLIKKESGVKGNRNKRKAYEAIREAYSELLPTPKRDRYQEIKRGFAKMLVLNNAARKAKADKGVFTPKDLLSAIDSSDGRALGSARAFGQETAEAGQDLIPRRETARPNLLATGAGAAGLGIGGAAAIPIAAPAIAALAANTKLGNAFIRAVIQQNPGAIRKILAFVSKKGAQAAALPAARQANVNLQEWDKVNGSQ